MTGYDFAFFDTLCHQCGVVALSQQTRSIADFAASDHVQNNSDHNAVVIPIPKMFSNRSMYSKPITQG